MCILQKEDLNFVVGMRVRALGDIVDGIDGTPDPTAGPAEPGWTFAVHGDLGTVEYVNGYGDPTVRFDRTGTASICSPWELDIVPTATDARLPFPQADNPLRVMEVVDAVIDGHRTGQQLTGHFGFDERQSYYYGRAAAYLGLLRPVRGGYELTGDAHRFSKVNMETRKAMMVGAMLERPVLREAVAHLASTGTPAPLEQVLCWLERHTELKIGTRRRRAQTVLAWCSWLAEGA